MVLKGPNGEWPIPYTLLNRRTTTWNLFVLYSNEKPFYFKILQHNAKAGHCPAFAHFGEDEKKKAIGRNLLSIQNEAISLVTVSSKQLRLVEENRATVKKDSRRRSLWNENLQRKQN